MDKWYKQTINKHKCLGIGLVVALMISLLANAGLFYKWRQAKSYQWPHSILTSSGHMTRNDGYELPSSGLVQDYQPASKAIQALAARAGNEEMKVLFIGNSITLHPINDYWWGEWGMAADQPEHDYVHTVAAALSKYTDVSYNICNFGTWEVMAHDRAEVLPLLDAQLSADEDLIVIQLGENVNDAATLLGDYAELIRYCRQKAPKAEIVVVGNFWQNPKVEQAKAGAVAEEQVRLADLTPIKNQPEAESAIGTIVEDKNNQEHEVQHQGVAKHPSNIGMQAIAALVLRAALE